jgi:hypothetical protein
MHTQMQQKNMTEQVGQQVPGSLNTARGLAGAGTQTAGLALGGFIPAQTGATEEYDGASWTTSNPGLSTATFRMGGAGTQTAGLAFGGYVPLLQV